MKNFIKYFIGTIVIGIILYIGFRIQLNLVEVAETTFRITSLVIFGTLFPIFIGMLLRIPRLIQEIREEKQWKVNWMKLVAIGLPSLYIIIAQLLFFTSFGHYLPFSLGIFQLMDSNITTIISLVFGYVLLDSLMNK
ncbi:hypothetical protein [Alkalihalobacillus deserti]|uniref:hypothetical protein n=1 Tax=Alkalihalobacillus deserti TaxID=2879466 RepID=UPI0035586315